MIVSYKHFIVGSKEVIVSYKYFIVRSKEVIVTYKYFIGRNNETITRYIEVFMVNFLPKIDYSTVLLKQKEYFTILFPGSL